MRSFLAESLASGAARGSFWDAAFFKSGAAICQLRQLRRPSAGVADVGRRWDGSTGASRWGGVVVLEIGPGLRDTF